MAQYAGNTTTLSSDVLLGQGSFLCIGSTIFGVSVGGLSFDPGTKWVNLNFDGKIAPVQGLDYLEESAPKITGKFLQYGTGSIGTFEPGGLASFASVPPTGNYTPVSGAALLLNGAYLVGVRLGFPTTNGQFEGFRFPVAYVSKYTVKTDGKKPAEIDATFTAVLHATASLNSQPYDIFRVNTLP